MTDPEILALGLAWGAVVALPLARRARDEPVRRRTGVTPRRAPRHGRWSWGPIGRVVAGLRRRRALRRDREQLDAELPVTIDLLVVAMGAGSPPYAALEVATRWAPERIGRAFAEVIVATRLGRSLPDALAVMARSEPALDGIADALIAGARLGAPTIGTLGRLADDARAEHRRRVEARARVLPVRLLFPLVFLVLPAFGLLTVAPALLSGLAHL